MADVPPHNPGAPIGAEPLKKTTGKVQPKKETVRINLPPKPSAAPTIKLPTLPPGGPTGAPSAARPASASPRLASAAPAAAPRAAAAPAAARPVRPAAAAPTVGTLDTILAVAAMVTALAAIGTTVWMLLTLNNVISNNF
ncbi:MAG TPA: hypothetical protein VMH30_00070 [Verrucomicrobiae bacterium]|nr:hypothetical protein [Verrucomicrobiae bacterium]